MQHQGCLESSEPVLMVSSSLPWVSCRPKSQRESITLFEKVSLQWRHVEAFNLPTIIPLLTEWLLCEGFDPNGSSSLFHHDPNLIAPQHHLRIHSMLAQQHPFFRGLFLFSRSTRCFVCFLLVSVAGSFAQFHFFHFPTFFEFGYQHMFYDLLRLTPQ